MKIFKTALTLISAFAITSCVDEMENPVSDNFNEDDKVEMTFVASLDDDTKTTLVNDVEVWWEPGDRIIINGDLFTSDIEENAKVAQFSGHIAKSEVYYAIYPSSNYWDGSEVSVWFTPDQSAETDDLPVHISAAKTDTPDEALVFRNVLGYIGFTVTDKSWKLESVKVKANNGEPLAGSFTVDYSGQEPVLKLNDKSTYPYVALISADGMEPGKYYIGLAPGTYEKGLTFEFKSKDGKYGVRSINRKIELKRGVIQDIGTADNIEDVLEQERETLIAFYEATGGDNWNNNTNWCSDKPINEWYGVITDKSDWFMGSDHIDDGTGPGHVRSLSLSGNNLRGEIPEVIGNLTHLVNLDLGSNRGLTGSLPSALFKLPQLRFLHIIAASISGSLPDNVGDAQMLQELYVSSNDLSGQLPASLYDLTELRLLRLDWNSFEGTISSEIGNLKRLTTLNLEANGFSGAIPDEMSVILNNEDLFQFSIGGNKFSGVLPQSVVQSEAFAYLWPTILNQDPSGGGIDIKSLDISGPDEIWEDIYGNQIVLPDVYKDNELTLLFKFAAWCPYSQEMTVKLLPFYEAYADKGLEVIEYGNIDWSWSPRDSMEDIQERINSLGIRWPVVVRDCGWGPDGNHSNVTAHKNDSKLMGNLPGFPSILAVDRKGNVVYQSVTQGYSGIIDFIATYMGEAEVGQPELYQSKDYSRDGEVVTLQSHTAGNGIDLVFIGDGFVDTDMSDGGNYETVMREGMEAFFSEEPVKSFRNHFNVYAVKAVSENNIISASTNTAFSTTFSGGTHVGGYIPKCFDYAAKVPGIDIAESMVICIMNARAYAGTCYMFTDNSAVAFFPLGYDDDMFVQLLNHEAVGHGFGKLLDEYEDNLGAVPAWMITDYLDSQAPLGWGANIDFTSDPTEVKWKNFLEDACYSSEGLGVYEGAMTYQYGAYRPTQNSIMRHNTGGFNAPSRYELYRRIMEYSGSTSSYEDFVEYDAVNRTSESGTSSVRKRRANYVEKTYEPTHPPVVINGSWRDAVK